MVNSVTLPMLNAFHGRQETVARRKWRAEHSSRSLRFLPRSDGALTRSDVHSASRERNPFSADAFGSYGALDGGLFDDEVDYDRFLETG